jgi:hypothetical protein
MYNRETWNIGRRREFNGDYTNKCGIEQAKINEIGERETPSD